MSFSIYFSVAALAVSVATLVWNFVNIQRQRNIDALFRQRDYYLKFLQYCIDNVDLDVFDVPNEEFVSKGYDKKSVMIVYHLILAGERQFLYDRILNRNVTAVEEWKPWLEGWSKREVFHQVWDVMRPVFVAPDRDSRDFVKLMDSLMEAAKHDVQKS